MIIRSQADRIRSQLITGQCHKKEGIRGIEKNSQKSIDVKKEVILELLLLQRQVITYYGFTISLPGVCKRRLNEDLKSFFS